MYFIFFLDVEHNISWEEFYNRIPTANRYYFIFYKTTRTTRTNKTRSVNSNQLNIIYLSRSLKTKWTYLCKSMFFILIMVHQTYMFPTNLCISPFVWLSQKNGKILYYIGIYEKNCHLYIKIIHSLTTFIYI